MITEPIFENTKIAFALKSDVELERAFFLFKMISIQPLVKIGTAATNLAIKANLPVEGLIRVTVFNHFCGGVNEEDCLPVIDKMYEKGVSSVLDYSVEGKENEAEFDSALMTVLRIMDFAKERKAMPIAVFKPTGFGRFKLFEKLGRGDDLSKEERDEWHRVESRFDTVCKKAKDNGLALLIDAEESWMQDAADELVTKMMQKYNTEKAVVFNTLQLYRHDRLDYLKKQHELARQNGYYLGYKIVRGAYMEKENERAEEYKYESPICKNKFATDTNFDQTAQYILDHLEDICLFAGTHNEDSTYLIMEQMKMKQLFKECARRKTWMQSFALHLGNGMPRLFWQR